MTNKIKRYTEILNKLNTIEVDDVLVDIELDHIKNRIQKKITKAKLDNLLGGVLSIYEFEEVSRD